MLSVEDILQPENVSYTDNVWTWAVAHMLHKGEDWQITTITDTAPIEIVFLSKGEPLTDFIISGNTVQDGTPTPEAPVDVVGCGARTGNLLNVDTSVTGYNISANGEIVENANYVVSDYIPVQSGAYTLSLTNGHKGTGTTANRVLLYDIQKQNAVLILDYSDTRPVNVIKTINVSFDGFIRVSHRITDTNVMLNTGSTEKPYEPYGYKLPFTVNGTEYPIYLGQVPTTRRIKKLALDGTENWSIQHVGATATTTVSIQKSELPSTPNMPRGTLNILSTHFKVANPTKINIGEMFPGSSYLNFNYDGTNDLTVFKSYLAQQYAAGTPVTIWYVMSEPETGIVNEPLMKIGDYADTLSMAQAGATIPTVAGTNTLLVDTTVQPSSMSITGKIREAADV